MFDKINIHKKLYLVLGFLISMFFIGTEWSLYQSSQINARINTLYSQEILPLEDLSHLKGALYRIRDRTLRIADASNAAELEKHKKVIEKQLHRIQEAIDDYDDTRLSYEEKKQLEIFQKNLQEYVRVLKNKIYPLSESLNNEEKINTILYKEAIDNFRTAREALNTLSEYQIQRAKQRLYHANEIFNTQRLLMQLLIVFIIFLSLYFSRKLMKSILVPIEKISEILKRITEYDFSKKLSIEGRNEFTQIALMLNENIETLKNTFSKLNHIAHYDALTNTPNRRAFEDEITKCLSTKKHDFALMFLDVDNFKNINDTYGHDVGDKFLVLFTKRIKSILRSDDFFARLGGDEFAIIIKHTLNEVHLGNIANKIIDKTSEPYFCHGHTIFSSVSIGIVTSSIAQSSQELMSFADIAMYETKNNGKANYTFFNHEMQRAVEENLELENGLRDALKNGEFELYYQPIMEPKLGTLYGIETLIRWRKDAQLISPLKFLPKLESSGLIKEVTYFIIEETFSMIDAERLRCIVSINLSILQFYDDNFLHFLKRMLQKYKHVNPQNVYFEITESIFAQNSEYISRSMLLIKEMGFHFSLDDFGTGYSSLSYLKDYPISTLKIDKSFIDNIHIDKKSEKLFSSIVHVAKTLGFTVVVEGVESKKTLDLVTQHNTVKVQGFYYYKPLSKEEFLSIMK